MDLADLVVLEAEDLVEEDCQPDSVSGLARSDVFEEYF